MFVIIIMMFWSALFLCTVAAVAMPAMPAFAHKPKRNKATLPGAIVIMTLPDWKIIRGDRNCGFNMTMDRLVKFWHRHNPYPVILMGDYKWASSDLNSIRNTWPSLDIMFLDITQSFRVSPPLLQLEDEASPLSDIAYKRMITFFFHGFTNVPELMIYKYLMRVDDDSCLDNRINYDIFREMQKRRSVYAYQALITDSPDVTAGLYEFIDEYAEKFNVTFANQNMHDLRKSNNNRAFMFSNNLEVIDTVRYRQPSVMHFINYVVSSNMIFHRRWGDAPLRYALAELFYGPNEVLHFCEFTYFHSSWGPHYGCDYRSHFNAVLRSARDEIERFPP